MCGNRRTFLPAGLPGWKNSSGACARNDAWQNQVSPFPEGISI